MWDEHEAHLKEVYAFIKGCGKERDMKMTLNKRDKLFAVCEMNIFELTMRRFIAKEEASLPISLGV